MIVIGCSNRAGNSLSKEERFKQYLLGIKYLEAADNLSIELKSAYYKKLVKTTGITGKEAEEIIKAYYGKPEKWKIIVDSIIVKEENRDTHSTDAREKDPHKK